MSRRKRKQPSPRPPKQDKARTEAPPAPRLREHRPIAYLSLLAASLLSPLALRALALVDHQATASSLDFPGIWADLMVGTAVAVLLGLAVRAWKPLALVVGAAWVALNYANYESIQALGSLLNLGFVAYAADPTFILGSALAPLRPLVLLGLLAATLALVWVGSRNVVLRSPGRAALSGAGLLLLGFPLFVNNEAEFWRQTHVVTGNLRWLVAGGGGAAGGDVGPLAGDVLEGSRFVGEVEGAPNVLLILVEAASGAYVAPSAAAQGVSSSVTMPGLSELAERGLNYSSFVVQQVQTNRGQYAALCGDYPKLALGSPKMSDAVAADTTLSHCLPDQLRRLGYETVYAQSAPLAFMLKDQFMPLSGFSRSYGDSWYREAYARDMWGVDDRAFFEQTVDLVRELHAEGRPWFLTLLTSGTHHPYRLPDEVIARAQAGSDPFDQAIRYADRALTDFVDRLEELGILESTLVLITADESNGLHGDTDAVSRRLSRNWGPLVVMEPGKAVGRIDQPFLQMDLAPSVLDYLGHEELAASYPGRSIFRTYDEPRTLGFGNVYQRAVFALTGANRIVSCDDRASVCETYEVVAPERLFSPARTVAVSAPEDREAVASLIGASVTDQRPSVGARVIPLLAVGDVEIEEHTLEGATVLLDDGQTVETRQQYVFGGQSLTIPAGARVDVDIAFEVVGEPGATVQFLTGLGTLRQDEGFYVKSVESVLAGQHVTIGYTWVPDEPWTGVDARMWAARTAGESSLKFSTARLTLVPPGAHQHPMTGRRSVERVFEVR